MARNSTYQLRLDEELKQKSFSVFHDLGMTPAEGMRIFLTMVVKTKSIPFAIEHKPNEQTAKLLLENKEYSKPFKTVEDLFTDLDS